MGRSGKPFHFMGCWELREMLGRRAFDERELVDGIEEVPLDSIYMHTHAHYLRHKYIAGPYPNDFATWAAIQVRDRVLGEKLAVVDPFEFPDLNAVRAELISLIDDHLRSMQTVPRIVFGEPFEFMQCRTLEVPTGIKVRTLAEFRDALANQVDISVIYYHVIAARRHRTRRQGDFATWVRHELGNETLANQIGRLSPYGSSLEGIRGRLVAACDAVLSTAPDQMEAD
jgi:hypothetical protein